MYQNSRYRTHRPPKRKASKWPFALAAIVVAFIVLSAVLIIGHFTGKANSKTHNSSTKQADSFNKSLYSNDDPASIWLVVNKQRPLNPKDYTPSDLRAPNIPLRRGAVDPEMQIRDAAATALETMAAAAAQKGANLMLASGFRSYDTQVRVYGSEVAGFGQAAADQESARPGHSEHQTGLAADLEPSSRKCEIEACFAETIEGKWLAANAYKFGFIIRYTPDKVAVTGYKYEPWHVRYVGTELSTEMHNKRIKTLEEFFGLPAAPNY